MVTHKHDRSCCSLLATAIVIAAACGDASDSKGDIDLVGAFGEGGKGDFASHARLIDEVRPGDAVSGEFHEDTLIHGYIVGARAGAQLTLKLATSQDQKKIGQGKPHDTYMGVFGPFGGVHDPGDAIAVVDDGSTGVEAPPVTFVAPETGYYLVAFLAWEQPGSGSYSLSFACEPTISGNAGGDSEQCLAPAGRSAAISVALSNPEVDRELARQLAGNTVSWVQRHRFVQHSPRVLIVRDDFSPNEHPKEQDALVAMLTELGYDADVLEEPVAGLDEATIADYDVVWFTNPGSPIGTVATGRTLRRFVERGGGVVLSGDDIPMSSANVGVLTRLEARDNGTQTCGLITDNMQGASFRVTFAGSTHPMSVGLQGKSFVYRDDIDNAWTFGENEQVLAWATLDDEAGCSLKTPVVVAVDHFGASECDSVLGCNGGCSTGLFSSLQRTDEFELGSAAAYAAGWVTAWVATALGVGTLDFPAHPLDADWWHRYSPVATKAEFGDVMVCTRFTFTPTSDSDTIMETSIRGQSEGMVVGVHPKDNRVVLKTRSGAPNWTWEHHAEAPLAFDLDVAQDFEVLLYGEGDRFTAEVRNATTGEVAKLQTTNSEVAKNGVVGLLGWDLELPVQTRRVLIGSPTEGTRSRLLQ